MVLSSLQRPNCVVRCCTDGCCQRTSISLASSKPSLGACGRCYDTTGNRSRELKRVACVGQKCNNRQCISICCVCPGCKKRRHVRPGDEQYLSTRTGCNNISWAVWIPCYQSHSPSRSSGVFKVSRQQLESLTGNSRFRPTGPSKICETSCTAHRSCHQNVHRLKGYEVGVPHSLSCVQPSIPYLSKHSVELLSSIRRGFGQRSSHTVQTDSLALLRHFAVTSTKASPYHTLMFDIDRSASTTFVCP